MKQQWSKMKYDHEQDRWVVDAGNYSYELHCGDCFDILIGSTGIPCRVEYDHQWYIIMPGVRFNLRIGSSYKVEI